MRERIIFLLGITTLTFLNACQQDEEFNLIPSDQMIDILIEQHVLEAKVGQLRLKNDTLHRVYNSFEKEIFKKYGTNKIAYEESFSYYMTQPELLEKMYEVVVDSLNVYNQEATLAEEEFRAKKKQEREQRRIEAKALRVEDSIKLNYDSVVLMQSVDSIMKWMQWDTLSVDMKDSLVGMGILREVPIMEQYYPLFYSDTSFNFWTLPRYELAPVSLLQLESLEIDSLIQSEVKDSLIREAQKAGVEVEDIKELIEISDLDSAELKQMLKKVKRDENQKKMMKSVPKMDSSKMLQLKRSLKKRVKSKS